MEWKIVKIKEDQLIFKNVETEVERNFELIEDIAAISGEDMDNGFYKVVDKSHVASRCPVEQSASNRH